MNLSPMASLFVTCLGWTVQLIELTLGAFFPMKTSWDPPFFPKISGWRAAQPLATIVAGNPAGLDQIWSCDLWPPCQQHALGEWFNRLSQPLGLLISYLFQTTVYLNVPYPVLQLSWITFRKVNNSKLFMLAFEFYPNLKMVKPVSD